MKTQNAFITFSTFYAKILNKDRPNMSQQQKLAYSGYVWENHVPNDLKNSFHRYAEVDRLLKIRPSIAPELRIDYNDKFPMVFDSFTYKAAEQARSATATTNVIEENETIEHVEMFEHSEIPNIVECNNVDENINNGMSSIVENNYEEMFQFPTVEYDNYMEMFHTVEYGNYIDHRGLFNGEYVHTYQQFDLMPFETSAVHEYGLETVNVPHTEIYNSDSVEEVYDDGEDEIGVTNYQFN